MLTQLRTRLYAPLKFLACSLSRQIAIQVHSDALKVCGLEQAPHGNNVVWDEFE